MEAEPPMRFRGALLIAAALAGPAAAADRDTCLACHGQTGTDAPVVETDLLQGSVHAALDCTRCHPGAEEIPHAARMSAPACATCHPKADVSYRHTVHGAARARGVRRAAGCADCHGGHGILAVADPRSRVWRSRVPEMCGRCHAEALAAYGGSVHGRASGAGIREAPVCTDCHGEHTILAPRDPASSVSRGALTSTCAQCHASERLARKFGLPADRLATYQASYHGLAQHAGDIRAANCGSCHGWHDVLPSGDPRSAVHPGNLAATCGRCHPGAGPGLAAAGIHGGKAAGPGSLLLRLARLFYLLVIPGTLGGMVVHNGLDWLRKARAMDRGRKAPESGERLTRHERWQHGLLLASFTVLAYSGFALKFPDGWWAAPFGWCGGEIARKAVHRWTALVFLLDAAWHLGDVLGTRAGRERLRALRPGRADIRDAGALLAYNLGRRRLPPDLPHPSYIAKTEYWALVWGSAVMAVTGAVLAYNSLALRWLPAWLLELATLVHFLEAVLATLAVLVWHGYWVVLDPDVYPMNWAWLTGRPNVPPGGGIKGR